LPLIRWQPFTLHIGLPRDVSRTKCCQLKVSFGPSSKEGHHHNTFVRLGMTTSILKTVGHPFVKMQNHAD
jgi:hypothetical protein